MPSTISPTRPGSCARRQLPLAPEHDQPPPHPRDEHDLDRHDHDRYHAEPEILDHDEQHGRQRLAAEQRRLHEGIADEAAQRLDLVLDHGRHFGGLHALEVDRRKPQHAVDQLEADTPQHALAEPALVGVDVEFEEAVDDDQQEEHTLSAISVWKRSS